jgi:filamentous hemagglutinin family protein
MRTSIFKKVNRDILLEYVYDDNNFINEPYSILNDVRSSQLSYIGGNLTSNGIDNQLFPIDIVQNKWGKINTSSYNFLNLTNYSGGPIRHDIIKLHFPANWNFGEYLGIFLKVYCYDFQNRKLINLSNFYFNKYEQSQNLLLGQISPPFLYENKLWDKRIYLDVPSVNFVSLQRSSGVPISDSLNDVLTNGEGLSITSPIFIDFQFILGTNVVGGNTQYILSSAFTTQIDQSPRLNEIQIFAEESNEGDFFEIFPIYNNSFDDFITWIESSFRLGFKYYIEFLLTVFEENIKGKTYRFLIEEDFSNKIEWRPIIKSSTNNAIIDVEMRLIDRTSNSTLTRKAIYGLKPNQTSKYSLNLKKIKVRDINKPKIYVKKKIELSQIDAITRRDQSELVVQVEVPTLFDITKIHAYSPNDTNPKVTQTLSNFHPLGVMKILVNPFDNIFKFTLAMKDVDKLDYLDLTNCQEIKLSFRSDKENYEFGLYSTGIDLKNGSCSFKVSMDYYQNLKNIFNLKNNLFYITTTNNGVKTMLYSGLFTISENLDLMDNQQEVINVGEIILQDEINRGTAIVTRRRIKVD